MEYNYEEIIELIESKFRAKGKGVIELNDDGVIELNDDEVKTENGDIAYESSGDFCVDLLGVLGASRHNLENVLSLFIKAFNSDSRLALKILFYARDIRGGQGERDVVRHILRHLSISYPSIVKQLLPYIVEVGRYDDLLVTLNTAVEEETIKFIKAQLDKDMDSLKNGLPVSLLGKWLPSINTSNGVARKKGMYIAKKLGMDNASYRKMLSSLRKGRIIENNLREKDYTFSYEKTPSKAMHKYREAFKRNDKERYTKYLSDVKEGKAKINTGTLYPYDIIREYSIDMDEVSKNAMQVKWDNLARPENLGNTIVVRDGSGSMSGFPLEVATSLSIYFAESLKGDFANRFITFSSKPKLVTLNRPDLFSKLTLIEQYNEAANTDISKVYKLIIDTYKNGNIAKEDMIKRIIIISDMEFDEGVSGVPTYTTFNNEFEKLGFEMPQIIYWNVDARNIHFAAIKDQPNIKFVSGFNPNMIDSIIKYGDIEQKEFVKECTKKYAFIDEIKID